MKHDVMLKIYRDGIITANELYNQIVSIASSDNVDEIMTSIPPEVFNKIKVFAANYDGRISFTIGNPPPITDEAVNAIRAWFAQHPQ